MPGEIWFDCCLSIDDHDSNFPKEIEKIITKWIDGWDLITFFCLSFIIKENIVKLQYNITYIYLCYVYLLEWVWGLWVTHTLIFIYIF